MTDFVLERSKQSILGLTFEESLKKSIKTTKEIFEYANFLKQPLKLEMFIPCDEDGNVLITPTEFNPIYWSEQYAKAKEKVLFDGFEWKKSNFSQKTMLFLIYKQVYFLYDVEDRNFQNAVDEYMETIEDLIPYNLELTKNFKQ